MSNFHLVIDFNENIQTETHRKCTLDYARSLNYIYVPLKRSRFNDDDIYQLGHRKSSTCTLQIRFFAHTYLDSESLLASLHFSIFIFFAGSVHFQNALSDVDRIHRLNWVELMTVRNTMADIFSMICFIYYCSFLI